MRRTKQRATLTEVLDRSERPLSVAELHAAASKRVAGLGIATVYRAIAAMLEGGEITAVEIPGEPPRYERAGKEHHHHFSCERCERVFDLSGCLENLRKMLPPKFEVRGHSVTLYGLCPACAG